MARTNKRPKEKAIVRPSDKTEKTRQAVDEAVLQLICSGNIEFNFLDVARLSGVHRVTIYRRWPDRKILIRNALARHQSVINVDYTGDFQEDLRRLAFAVRDFFANPREIAMVLVLASSKNQEFVREFLDVWQRVNDKEMALIANAKESGEIAVNVNPDIVLAMLVNPIMAEVLFERRVPADEYLDLLVAHIMQMCVPSKTPEALKMPAPGRKGASSSKAHVSKRTRLERP